MISEFPLFCFTTLAGLGAGAYAVSAVFPLSAGRKRPWLFPLVCLILLAAGLIFLPLHLGHPERIPYALAQPGAMIAQEAYWSAAFGVIVLVDLVMTAKKGQVPRALRIVGALAALGLTCVMANAYFVSLGVPAWSSWQTFPVFPLADLAMGAALLAVFEDGLLGKPAFRTAAGALSVIAAAAFALEAAHFANVGSDMTLLAVGAVVAVVGAAVEFASAKMPARTAAVASCACLVVAVAIARYGFYAACTL